MSLAFVKLVSDGEDDETSGTETSASRLETAQALDPMDVETYRLILSLPEESDTPRVGRSESESSWRRAGLHIRDEWNMIAHNVELQYESAELRLRQDLAANKMRWYGDWQKDLWCFLRNNHPVVSVCYSHPLHPASRRQRLFAYFLMSLFVIYLTCILTEADQCMRCNITHCLAEEKNSRCFFGDLDLNATALNGTVSYFRSHYPAMTSHFCCTCSHMGIFVSMQWFGRLGASVYALVFNVAFTMFIFQSMMCLCVQSSSTRKRELCSLFGYGMVGLTSAGLISLLPLIVYYIQLRHMLPNLLGALVVCKLGGWACVTLMNVAAFHVMWRTQPNGRAGGSTFHVTAEDFQDFVQRRSEE